MVRARATNAAAKMDRHLGEEQGRAAGWVPLGHSPPNGHSGHLGGGGEEALLVPGCHWSPSKGCSPPGGHSLHKGPEGSKRHEVCSLCGPWLGPSPTHRQGL